MGSRYPRSRSRRVLAERLGKTERPILETLMRVYPAGLNKKEVAARAGYEANGGGFNNALGRMRTLKLVQGRGERWASKNPARLTDDMMNRRRFPFTIRSDT